MRGFAASAAYGDSAFHVRPGMSEGCRTSLSLPLEISTSAFAWSSVNILASVPGEMVSAATPFASVRPDVMVFASLRKITVASAIGAPVASELAAMIREL